MKGYMLIYFLHYLCSWVGEKSEIVIKIKDSY